MNHHDADFSVILLDFYPSMGGLRRGIDHRNSVAEVTVSVFGAVGVEIRNGYTIYIYVGQPFVIHHLDVVDEQFVARVAAFGDFVCGEAGQWHLSHPAVKGRS